LDAKGIYQYKFIQNSISILSSIAPAGHDRRPPTGKGGIGDALQMLHWGFIPTGGVGVASQRRPRQGEGEYWDIFCASFGDV